MDGSSLRKARQRAGISQRELAARTGVAQPTIARIERDTADPLLGTLTRLLAACGQELEVRPILGAGVDRSGIRELLRMSPAQRLATLVEEAAAAERLAPARPVG